MARKREESTSQEQQEQEGHPAGSENEARDAAAPEEQKTRYYYSLFSSYPGIGREIKNYRLNALHVTQRRSAIRKAHAEAEKLAGFSASMSPGGHVYYRAYSQVVTPRDTPECPIELIGGGAVECVEG